MPTRPSPNRQMDSSPANPDPRVLGQQAEAVSAGLRAVGTPVAATALVDSLRMVMAEGSIAPWADALARYGYAAHVEDRVDVGRLAADLFPCVLLGPGRPAVLTAPVRLNERATLLFVRPRLDREASTVPTSWPALLATWRPTVARAAVAAMLANVLALAAPIFSAQVYDRVLPHGLVDSLAVMAVIFFVSAFFEQVFRRLRALFIEDALHEGNVRLAMDMHRRILETRFDGTVAPSGHLMRHLQDYDAVRDGFGAAAVSLLADLPFTALFLFGLFLCDSTVALAMLGLNGAITLASLLAIRRQRLLFGELSQAATRRAQAAQESFTDPETARRVGAAALLQARFRQGTVLHAAAARTIRSLSALRGNLAMFAQNLAVLLAVGIGAWHAIDGSLSAGVVLAASMLATRFTGSVMQLVSVIPQGLSALTALEAMRKITERPTERSSSALVHRPICRGNLQLDGVTARYGGMIHPAVIDVGLSVAAGGRLAVIGPSGSGKTTLEKIVTGILVPEKGRVLLDGIEVGLIEPADLRRHIAVCPQSPPLYSGPLRANLSFDGRAGDEQMLQMLAALGGDAVMPVGMGLDFEVAEMGRNLSGGQRQLVALARTLLCPAAVLILDEPTAGLDEATEQAVIRCIDQATAGRTLIVISHRPAVVMLAPRVAVMNRGRVIRQAAREELLVRKGAR